MNGRPESVGTLFLSVGNDSGNGKLLKQRGLLSRQADIRRGIDASRIAFLPAVLMRWSIDLRANSVPRGKPRPGVRQPSD